VNFSYIFHSSTTWSFWRYALFSKEGFAKIFAAVGVQFALMEGADFFNVYTKDKYGRYAIIVMIVLAVIWVAFTRRPISSFVYNAAGNDVAIEVRIGDLFEGEGDVVVSTNTTFDTDLSSGLIDTASVQGQVATVFFNANTAEIDQQLSQALVGIEGVLKEGAVGKTTEYPIGTTATIAAHSRNFYFVAMAHLNANGNAHASPREIEDALERLWEHIRHFGDLRDVSIPLVGTGRGRTGVPRKKMVEKIAQSYVDASKSAVFINKLSIVIRPEDAANFSVNLYEIRDYLVHGIH